MSMGLDLFVREVSRSVSLPYTLVTSICNEWISEGRDFGLEGTRRQFIDYLVANKPILESRG